MFNVYETFNKSRAGSSGVFVGNSLSVTMRADLDISVPGIFETVWFDIDQKLRSKKITFGVVYRHCGITDILFFQRKLELLVVKGQLDFTDPNLQIK